MKILILTGKFGMGHYSAAKAIEKKLQKNCRLAQIQVVDIFEHTYKELCQLLYKSYHLILNKGAALYNVAYKKATKNSTENQTIAIIYKHLYQKISMLLLKEVPDVVISTYSVSSMLVSEFKQKTQDKLQLLTVITDINPHDTWVNPKTDAYLVADQRSKNRLYQMGVRSTPIAIAGMPLGEEFERILTEKEQFPNVAMNGTSLSEQAGIAPSRDNSHDKNTIRQTKESKRLLIMGGGLGLIPKELSFYERINRIEGLETVVITGRNEALYKKLAHRFDRIEVLGYCNTICEQMRKADLLLTKSGGISTFEAICTKTPMLIFKPFLEQEVANADFVQKENMGLILSKGLERCEEEIETIEHLIHDEALLQTMQENMHRVCKQWQTEAIVHMIQSYQQQSA